MDVRRLPLEILERILLHLDTQALAACALSDPYLANIIYSSHFLDGYCRMFLSCSWVTAADICNACISVPFEFWFWVHTTIKVEESGTSNITFHNKYLTKIGTLRHMYIMWVTCGLRPSLMYSYSLMHELYSLPDTVDQAFKTFDEDPGPVVKDRLVKIFLGLPEIMELTCGNLELFRMQRGGTRSLHMDIVCNDGINPKLPLDFVPLFSVELILSALFGKNPSLLILIGKDLWVLWSGYLYISFDSNETSIADNSFCRYFKSESVSDIRHHAHHALFDMNNFVNSTRNGSLSPIISGIHMDMAFITIELAQDHHRSLQQKFNILLRGGCHCLINSILNTFKSSGLEKKVIVEFLKQRVCSSSEVTEFVLTLMDLNLNKVKLDPSEELAYLVSKCIFDRIACLFRNEIQFCVENRFSHSFLCQCTDFPGEWRVSSGRGSEPIVQQCVSERARDGLNSPKFWPPHVLSAGCQAIPLLVEVLEADISFITSGSVKYVVPMLVQAHINERLHNAGMCLTNRPPDKARCPPLLTQIRLWSIDSLV